MPDFDKWMHLVVGLAIGGSLWWAIERFFPASARRLNPLAFTLMLVWGASGLFFFRLLGIPVLSGQLFYMAVPDWDIPLLQWTGWSFLAHRSWLFHSVAIPAAIFGLAVALPNRFPLAGQLRDGALGLMVGMSAHLVWDAALSSAKRGFYIAGFSGGASLTWLMANVCIGLGVPLLLAWALQPGTADKPLSQVQE